MSKKVINFIISLFSSISMCVVGGIIFGISFVASFFGAMFYDMPTADGRRCLR